jgi:hypothetical protein
MIQKINSDNFIEMIESMKKKSFFNDFLKYLFHSPKNLFGEESNESNNYLYFPDDFMFYLAYRLIIFYEYFINFFGINYYWKNDSDRIENIHEWTDNRHRKINNYPGIKIDTPLSHEGMSIFLTNNYIYYLLDYKNDEFIIDTTFMNDYEYHDYSEHVGVHANLKLKSGFFYVHKISSDDRTYEYPNIPENIYYKLYAGALTYFTIMDHAYINHWYISAKMSIINEKFLPINHPIRRILYPTETSAINIASRAILTLVSPGAVIEKTHPFTYKGMEHMKSERKIADPYHELIGVIIEKKFSRHINQSPFKDIIEWHDYIKQFAENIVDIMYPTDNDIIKDPMIKKYISNYKKIYGLKKSNYRKILVRIIIIMYETQISHNIQSNELFLWYILHLPPLIRKNHKFTNYNVYQQFIRIYTTISTSGKWIPFDLNLSNLIYDSHDLSSDKIILLKKRWDEFYKNLHEINVDKKYVLLNYKDMEISTGL